MLCRSGLERIAAVMASTGSQTLALASGRFRGFDQAKPPAAVLLPLYNARLQRPRASGVSGGPAASPAATDGPVVPHVLFTLRAATLSAHAGEISFPGGHIDPGESAEEAAVRELREEVGVHSLQVQVLGTLPVVPGKNGKAVSPVLGFLPDADIATLHGTRNEAEVEAVFGVPLFEGLSTPDFEWFKEYRLPVYRPPEANGIKIWGLTAFVMHGVMTDILEPALAPAGSK